MWQYLPYSIGSIFCIKGIDPINNPLPAYVQDMWNDGWLTRYICGYNQYWDPDRIDPETDEPGVCEDFEECYAPSSPDSRDCKFDFFSEFGAWMNNSYPKDDTSPDSDCFVTLANINEEACCPIFQYGANTYEYVAISYYQK